MSLSVLYDFSFYDISSLRKLTRKKPRKVFPSYEYAALGKYKSLALRLNNNHLDCIEGLFGVTFQIIFRPEKLAWIDLSFNQISTIPEDFTSFTGLKILYLHGNKITSFKSLHVLTFLPKLYSLTLHGNPIENHRLYRKRIVTTFPLLRNLDFSMITAYDRDTAGHSLLVEKHRMIYG